MKLAHWTIIFTSMLTTMHSDGQETITIFFEFGQSKIPDDQLELLAAIPTTYDLSDLDSVSFIGMADSVGDFKSNIKLSEKRARIVASHCVRLFPEYVPTKIVALGERALDEREKNRRVDILLYFQPMPTEEVEQETPSQTEEFCYNIDYKLLHNCHLRTIKKGNKEQTIIESTLPEIKKNNLHYYGSSNENGEFVAKKVKWTSKRTGNSWWAKTRYVTTIPKENFDAYKIFTIKALPCDTCNEYFQSGTELSNVDTCLQTDRFLMNNIQFRFNFTNNRWVKIRAPREYVNIADRYFVGCFLQNELLWEPKQGKRKQNYYYSRLPVYVGSTSNITRLMNCCKNNSEPSDCDSAMIYCALLEKPDRWLILNAEIGSYYQESTFTPYAGLGFSQETIYSRFSLLAGVYADLNLYGSLRYQYHFLSFPFKGFNPFSAWQSPTAQQLIYKYGRLYLGTELKYSGAENNEPVLGQNIHIGLAAVNTDEDAFLARIFAQYGFEFGYSGTPSREIYPIVQLGINMQMAILLKNNNKI